MTCKKVLLVDSDPQALLSISLGHPQGHIYIYTQPHGKDVLSMNVVF
ncbi:hypothetical protein ACWYRQ_19160 [Clostridioides difficile]